MTKREKIGPRLFQFTQKLFYWCIFFSNFASNNRALKKLQQVTKIIFPRNSENLIYGRKGNFLSVGEAHNRPLKILCISADLIYLFSSPFLLIGVITFRSNKQQ